MKRVKVKKTLLISYLTPADDNLIIRLIYKGMGAAQIITRRDDRQSEHIQILTIMCLYKGHQPLKKNPVCHSVRK